MICLVFFRENNAKQFDRMKSSLFEDVSIYSNYTFSFKLTKTTGSLNPIRKNINFLEFNLDLLDFSAISSRKRKRRIKYKYCRG